MIVGLLTALVLGTSPLADIQVDGPGYLRFLRAGHAVYAKEASLIVHDGLLSAASGDPLIPSIRLEPGPISVSEDGRIHVGSREVGRLVLAVFPVGTQFSASGAFQSTNARARLAEPGFAETGLIRARVAPSDGTITIRPFNEVDGDAYTLGDVAAIGLPEPQRTRLASVKIGDTPPLGVERIVDATRVAARLRMAGINPSDLDIQVPQRSVVVRRGQNVTAEQLTHAAIEGAKAQMAPGALLSGTGAKPMTVPSGELSLVAENVRAAGGKAVVTVAAYVDGKRYAGQTIQLTQTGGPPQLRAGMSVRVSVISNDVRIDTVGRVRFADRASGLVTVVTPDGAELTGMATADGRVEVRA